MVGIQELRVHSLNCRAAIERCFGRFRAISLKEFPRGSCGDVSDILGMFLRETLEVECEYVSGWADGQSHAWLEIGEITIDITADQFAANEAVIVSCESVFHRKFDVSIRRRPDIDGASGAHLHDLRHDYHLIVTTARELATEPSQ
jgi:hypothetical protein